MLEALRTRADPGLGAGEGEHGAFGKVSVSVVNDGANKFLPPVENLAGVGNHLEDIWSGGHCAVIADSTNGVRTSIHINGMSEVKGKEVRWFVVRFSGRRIWGIC